MKEQTPLMQQYWGIKSAHQDKLLFFRMGDFYEMFFEDAVTAAPILGIALTSRNKKAADETPMCGLPHHAVAGPINKLLAHGYKVALCDQIEDPKLAKGIVKRAVTRILTPGMVYDHQTLNPTIANYLGCIEDGVLACIETSTGESFYFKNIDPKDVKRLLDVLGIVELVLVSADAEKFDYAGTVTVHGELHADEHLPNAARRLLAYVQSLSSTDFLALLAPFQEYKTQGRLELGSQTLKHLEIFRTFGGDEKQSFFGALDRTKTSGGARLLRQRISFPYLDKAPIEDSLSRIQKWTMDPLTLKSTRQGLALLGDLERRLIRIGQANAGGRDLLALADGIEKGVLSLEVSGTPFAREAQVSGLARKLRATLVEDPPVQTHQGGMIQKGVNEALDEQIELSMNAQDILLKMEAREREATGIPSLKIRFNGVFGYYIEITNTHRDKVPVRFIRKQTLASAERYSTSELVELEQKILAAQSRRAEIEIGIFQDLKKESLALSQTILELARRCAELDVDTALAQLALEKSYVRPTFNDQGLLDLRGSRHPVVEQRVDDFTPNDVVIERGHCILLTGPNMAGKSTLMRQVALIQLMAQVGSFVPASRANISLCDHIFTRIGASDNLSQGLSTFMVEMQETAEMVKNATPKSMLILDEVGRGTSTFDGLSLAQALLEHLIVRGVSSILFATHYHELTLLATEFPQIANAHMSVVERGGEIQFLHTLKLGPAQKSYGIQVAQLAGVPKDITDRAQKILRRLEEKKPAHMHQLSIFDLAPADEIEEIESLREEPAVVREVVKDRPFVEELRKFPVNEMTPMQALQAIVKWKTDLELDS